MAGSDFVSSEYLHVNACGVQKLSVNVGSYRPFGRSDYHLLYIAKGCCFVDFGEGEVAVREGNIIFYPPRVSQKYAFKAEIPSLSYFLHFSGTGCAELVDRFGFSSAVIRVGKQVSAEAKFSELIDEFRLKRPFYEEACAAHLLALLSLFAQKAHTYSATREPVHRSDITDVCRDMHSSVGESFSVCDLAARCNLSESRFSHVFRAQMGMSPTAYLAKIKVERAVELLESTDMSISDISSLLGFESQSYFCRFFKKALGASPSEFKNKTPTQ